MITKVKKWGNSLGLRIPMQIQKALSISENEDLLFIETPNGVLLKKNTVDTLASLLMQVRPETIHTEVVWGPELGKEDF